MTQFRPSQVANALLFIVFLCWSAASNAIDNSGIHRDDWYLAQEDSLATIQLSGHKAEADALDYIRAHKLDNQAGYYQTRIEGQPWFAVTYGRYDSLQAARDAMQDIPSALRRHSPWPRTFAAIKPLIAAQSDVQSPAVVDDETATPVVDDEAATPVPDGQPTAVTANVKWQDGQHAYEQGDYSQAFEIWKTLAEQGDKVSQFNLGVMYSRGEGIEQNGSQAIDWYTRSAEQGYAPAQFNLGAIYLDGKFVTPDERKTASWWQLAAEQDFVQAQYNIGSLYCRGIGVFRDIEQCKYWYGRAAKNGDEHARKMLEQISAGNKSQPDKSSESATTVAKATPASKADKKPPVAKAASQVTAAEREQLRQAQSSFIRGNYQRAYQLWLPLANAGHAEAQYSLGFLYHSGWGVERDLTQAKAWYERAAALEESRAQFNLGVLLLGTEEGAPKDINLATKWITRSARNGNQRARQFLAEAYSQGIYGFEQSDDKASYWRKQ